MGIENVFRYSAFADEASSDLTGQIDAMNSNGIEMLEIRGVNGKNISQVSVVEAKDIQKQLNNSGLSVWSIGSPTGKIGIKDDFELHLDQFKHMLELAEIFGAKKYRFFSFFIRESDLRNGKVPSGMRDMVIERLGRIEEAAKGSNIVLCHENEKDIYGQGAENCLDIHKNFPNIKAVFDPANFIQCGVDTIKAWEMLEPYVDYMHIKDAMRDGRVVPAGYGVGNVKELINRYKNIGGKVLSLEPHLTVFEGFNELEKSRNNKASDEKAFVYTSQNKAFEAAAKALKDLL